MCYRQSEALSGYVKWELYFDTRQPLGKREENIFDYPAPYLPDVFKQDINAHGKWHMTGFETRKRGSISVGPEWNWSSGRMVLWKVTLEEEMMQTFQHLGIVIPLAVFYGIMEDYFLVNGGNHSGYLNVSLILLDLLSVNRWTPMPEMLN